MHLLALIACTEAPGDPLEFDVSGVPSGGLGLDSGSADSGLFDRDGDGFEAGVDCDDTDPELHPGAAELCDGVDQDCDDQVDEDATNALTGFLDGDLDGYGDPASPWRSCSAMGPPQAGDCDDSDPRIYPGAREDCDGHDNNCDGWVDTMVAGRTHSTVQAAVDAVCEDGDTVWVRPGTYTENLHITRPLSLQATGPLKQTVLDGSGCGFTDCPTVLVSAPGVVLSGLTVQGGSRPAGSGGGVSALEGEDLVIRGCRITRNAALNGGGVAMHSGTLEDTWMDHNVSADKGGGLWLDNTLAAVTIATTVIENNRAAYGGGAYQYFHEPVLWQDNVIRGNSARLGGGLFVHGMTLETSGNVLQDNTATQLHSALGCGGGGVYLDSAVWTSAADAVSGNVPDDTCGG